MNKCMFFGRITRDVDLQFTAGKGVAVAKFGIAVNRSVKNEQGNYEADFINCVAFGKQAELIAEHFVKGNQICLNGRLQTGSYFNKEKVKVYTTDIVVEGFDFVAGNKGTGAVAGTTEIDAGLEPIEGEELPF